MPDHASLTTNARPARSSRRAVTPRAAGRTLNEFLVVGLGSSAGGLDACRKLVAALPANSGMAFVLVQHLDPTHKSMMVDLLSGHTTMTVLEATDGMAIEPDHLYVIAPGTYLAVGKGCLRVSKPQARTRRARAVRFSASFAGGGVRVAGRLRDPVRNGFRREHGVDGRQGKKRARHRTGPGRSRI